MKKYFVVSDIHGFYSELLDGLEDANFDIDNENHILVILGDIFDRGSESLELYEYLIKFNKNRLILIKGNHEYLYLDLLKKEYPDEYDFTNGTVDTFCQLAQRQYMDSALGVKTSDFLCDGLLYREFILQKEKYDNCLAIWTEIKNIVKKHNATKWIKSKSWLDYYEIDKYILVHSFIPTKLRDEYSYISKMKDAYPKDEMKAYDPDWRNGNWNEASWGCPWRQYQLGLFNEEINEGKILVCGHWHTSDFYLYLDNVNNDEHGIYYGKNIIGIDGGVFFKRNSIGEREFVHKQNVFVIEE